MVPSGLMYWSMLSFMYLKYLPSPVVCQTPSMPFNTNPWSYVHFAGVPDSFFVASLQSVFMAVSAIRSDMGAVCPKAIVNDAVKRIEKRIIPMVGIFASLHNGGHI